MTSDSNTADQPAQIRFAMPKGRMADGVGALLKDAGIRIRAGARDYRPTISLPGYTVKILKPRAVIEMLGLGTRDLGFAGADWVDEDGRDIVELLDTRLDPVRLVAAAPETILVEGENGPLLPDRPLRVASEYANLTSCWMNANDIAGEFVLSYGATEVLPDDADCIVDNTATGATLAANGLRIIDELATSSTRLYASKQAMNDDAKRAHRRVRDARAIRPRGTRPRHARGQHRRGQTRTTPRRPPLHARANRRQHAQRVRPDRSTHRLRRQGRRPPRRPPHPHPPDQSQGRHRHHRHQPRADRAMNPDTTNQREQRDDRALPPLPGRRGEVGGTQPRRVSGSAAPTSPITPSSTLAGLSPYSPPTPTHTIDLHLDANEGPGPSQSVLDAIARVSPDTIRRYPNAATLESKLAERLNIDPSRVLVTNGGDDAIDRACRAVLEAGRTAILHTPTFEMIPRGVRLAGATPVEIPWRTDGFPKQAFLDAIEQCNRETGQPPGMIALVTPNNPTGCVIPLRKILAIADAAPNSLILVDLAYIEFADEDPTPTLLERDNIMMVRTFSKARGLAGLRVGYALAPEPIITLLRTTGGPYPVSPISLAAAAATLDETDRLAETVARVRTERTELIVLLTRLGARPMPTQANFVTTDFTGTVEGGSEAVRHALAARGIAVRGWPTRPDLAGLLRITLPANKADFTRLTTALTEILAAPESTR